MRYLNPHQLEAVRRYCRALSDMEDAIVSDLDPGDQIKIASDIELVDSNGDLFMVTSDNGDGWELVLP